MDPLGQRLRELGDVLMQAQQAGGLPLGLRQVRLPNQIESLRLQRESPPHPGARRKGLAC